MTSLPIQFSVGTQLVLFFFEASLNRAASHRERPVRASQYARANAVFIVDRRRPAVAGNELRRVCSSRGGNKRVVRRPARHIVPGKLEKKPAIVLRTHAQQRFRETRVEEVAHDIARRAMGWRQPREDRIGFERAMLDEPQSVIERTPRCVMLNVP